MKQPKRINLKMLLIAVLALVMAFALVACNGDKKNNDDKSSDEVSETELYVGTGGIWDYMTKEDLEFLYGFLYTEVQRQPNAAGIVSSSDCSHSHDNDIDPIGCYDGWIMLDMPYDGDMENLYSFGYYIFASHENAVKYAAQEMEDVYYEYVIRNNLIFIISNNFPHIDDVKAGNYNLNDLPGEQMKIINTMAMKKNIDALYISLSNEAHTAETSDIVSGIGGYVAYYDNEYSNCLILEQMAHVSGDGADAFIDSSKQSFDQIYKSKIGIEYTDDSYIEVDKEEGYYHAKTKTKPGFRFESETEGEASVTDYYYDSEEGLDVVIPSTTPDGKVVTAIGYKFSALDDDGIRSITIPISVNTISYGSFKNFKDLQAVYYCGTEEQWNAIDIGSENNPFVNAKRYYFSEQPNNDGNHWHWNAQHKPEVWAN